HVLHTGLRRHARRLPARNARGQRMVARRRARKNKSRREHLSVPIHRRDQARAKARGRVGKGGVRMSGTAWPKEHLTYLADLVDKGRTASKAATEINRRFGTDYSASAMIGMAKRRGLHWKHKGGFDWHRKQAPAPFAQPLDLVAIMRKPKVAITSALDPDEIPV